MSKLLTLRYSAFRHLLIAASIAFIVAKGNAQQETYPLDAPGRRGAPTLEGMDDLRRDRTAPTGPPVRTSARFLLEEHGRQGVIQVAADIAPGWHLYSISQPDGGPQATRIVLSDSPCFEVTGNFVAEPPPRVVPADLFPVPEEFHEQRVVWTATIRVEDGVDPSQLTVTGHLAGQACEEMGACQILEAEATSFTGSYAGPLSASTTAAGATAATGAPTSTAALPTASLAPGLWTIATLQKLGIALLAGLILNLMPCVLPVIGLKIMSFAQQAGETPGRVLWLNVCFVAGLISVFMGLAALAAFMGWGWGQQFQRPEFSIVLVSVVFMFALSFLGIWEIPIPGFVGSGTAADLSEREGPVGAFFKGVLTTLLATPCSGPLIVPTLAWAVRQPKPMIFGTFACMGLGMGLPYLLVGFFPGLMKWLPKPGAWMDTFKQVMGFVLLGTVVWIFSFIHSDYFVATLALLFTLWAACWWIGRVPITADLTVKARSYVSAAGFAGLVGFFAFRALLPGETNWDQFTLAALDDFRDRGVTVFVDFTADW